MEFPLKYADNGCGSDLIDRSLAEFKVLYKIIFYKSIKDSSETLYIYQYEYADSSYVIFMMILWLYI